MTAIGRCADELRPSTMDELAMNVQVQTIDHVPQRGLSTFVNLSTFHQKAPGCFCFS